ncbi:hypothetical protein ANCCEY_07097 [Ancylostoma ceylanicum]|uniref:Serine carboxypeptidase S28 n=1 Tax=Ancylostoma ceylanicum TaxID=53326 RepID=A0A0D6M1Q6_9BILA|nr:hypothetical protein ANCCEY_07097 [Ancylostoma ceylanicum]
MTEWNFSRAIGWARELNLPKLSDAKEEYFDQKLDHFDGSSQQTWRQRYYHNFQYTSGSNNIKTVFLRLGGEGPLRMSTVSNEATPMMTLAKEHGAAVFALEHRFYGASRPTPYVYGSPTRHCGYLDLLVAP